MKAVIVGCGRVGALLASLLDAGGHDVSIVDISTLAFDRLPETFKGSAVRGNGTDVAVLRRAGTGDADLFIAVTEGDNRNVMSAQVAAESFGVKRVVAKINDPLRAQAYSELGIATICRTSLMTNALLQFLDLPPKGPTGVVAPSGHHPGSRHDAGEGSSGDAHGPGRARHGRTTLEA